MKHFFQNLIRFLFYSTIILLLQSSFNTLDSAENHSINNSTGTIYYFDGTDGNDSSDGLTPESAWKSLSKISSLTLQPGDQILLKCGTRFTKQYINLDRQKGSEVAPIKINSYGTGAKPVIDPADLFKYAITVTGCEYLEVENIEMTGGSGRVYFTWINEKSEFHHFVFRNLYIHDCYLSNGSAFHFNRIPKGETRMSEYSDILIENCKVNMIVRSAIMVDCLNNISILNNEFRNMGGPGVVLHKSRTGIISGNIIHSSGSTAHPSFFGRGSCSWMLGCSDIMIEKNQFINAHGWLDSYGFHLDIGNVNCIIQYNLSMDNAGGFVQILGKNKNCAYRYNISVNDGWRVKGEFDGPEKNIESGCVISLNGYTVRDDFDGPHNSYIYNNTIYVKEDIEACFNFRYTLDGVFIANNIFHIAGEAANITGNRKEREPADAFPKNIVYKNNLYLKSSNHPDGMLISDSEKLFGDVAFQNAGGIEPEDYIPGNVELIRDKGIEITKIPGDEIGLKAGLTVEKDFFGNPIVNKPDMGAIELLGAGLPDQASRDDFPARVYPTVSNGIVHILGEESQPFNWLTVTDVFGKQVLKKNVSGKEEIDFSGFSKGIYLFRINGKVYKVFLT